MTLITMITNPMTTNFLFVNDFIETVRWHTGSYQLLCMVDVGPFSNWFDNIKFSKRKRENIACTAALKFIENRKGWPSPGHKVSSHCATVPIFAKIR